MNIIEALSENKYQLIDLSKPLAPGSETRRLAVRRYVSEPMHDFHSEIDLMSHLGTHVESPYHFRDNWPDTLQTPIERYWGRAIVLHLADIAPGNSITGNELDQADKGLVQADDIVILTSPYVLPPFTPQSNTLADKRPYLGAAAGEWLAQKQVKAVGFGDSISIEKDYQTVYDFHNILMSRGILFLEVLQNLDKLPFEPFLLIYFPIPVAGLDSCPVRVVAVIDKTEMH